MDELLAAVQPYIDRFGGVGMAVVAALDTSFVSMPNVSDLLIVWQTIKSPHLWWYYALMTTLGSVVGSMVIYYFGRKGGEAFLLKRFKEAHVVKVRGIFARYGLWAMLLVAFMPPPAPYKIFVLLAGAGGVGTRRRGGMSLPRQAHRPRLAPSRRPGPWQPCPGAPPAPPRRRP